MPVCTRSVARAEAGLPQETAHSAEPRFALKLGCLKRQEPSGMAF